MTKARLASGAGVVQKNLVPVLLRMSSGLRRSNCASSSAIAFKTFAPRWITRSLLVPREGTVELGPTRPTPPSR